MVVDAEVDAAVTSAPAMSSSAAMERIDCTSVRIVCRVSGSSSATRRCPPEPVERERRGGERKRSGRKRQNRSAQREDGRRRGRAGGGVRHEEERERVEGGE